MQYPQVNSRRLTVDLHRDLVIFFLRQITGQRKLLITALHCFQVNIVHARTVTRLLQHFIVYLLQFLVGFLRTVLIRQRFMQMGKSLFDSASLLRRGIIIQLPVNTAPAVHQPLSRRQIVDRHRLLIMQQFFHHSIFHFACLPALLHLFFLIFFLGGSVLLRHPVRNISHDIPIELGESGFDLLRDGHPLLNGLQPGKGIVHTCPLLAAHRAEHILERDFRSYIDKRSYSSVIRLFKLSQHPVNTDIGRPLLFRDCFVLIQFI